MRHLLLDFRYAIRGLARTPLFTLGVVLTLALGIGANATMFGVVDVLFLRPPARVAEPDRIVRINLRQDYGSMGVITGPAITFPTYEDLRDHVPALDMVAAVSKQEMGMGRGTNATQVQAAAVSWQYFPMLGLHPALGRFFTDAEDRAGGDRVAVLTYPFWQRQFGGDSGIIGKSLPIGKGSYTVIGIAPQQFTGIDLAASDLFLPIHPAAEGDFTQPQALQSRNWIWLSAIGRLRPGASREQAALQVTDAFRRGVSTAQRPDTSSRAVLSPILESRAPDASSESSVGLWIGIVALIVLLIACANVANLMLARATQRRRELAVRASLGAGRGGLMRALLAESVVLAVGGGLGALLIAGWGVVAARRFLIPSLPAEVPLIDSRMVLFTIGIVGATALLTGLVPAWQASRSDLVGALKQGGRGGTGRSGTTRAVLLVAQISLTLVLLVGAGLFVKSLGKVQGIDVGFDADHVHSVTMNLSAIGMDARAANDAYLRLRDRLAAIPGVASVAASMGSPFNYSWAESVRAEGVDSIPALKTGGPYYMAVTPDYFRTLGIALTEGRDFTEDDRASNAPVVIVGATFAKLVWPGVSPIGKCLYRGDDSTTTCTRVIGVAADAARGSVTETSNLLYYLPYAQYQDPRINGLFVRARPGAGSLVAAIQREVRASGTLPFATVESLQDQIAPQLRSWQLGATAFTAFGLLALLIAATGVFSVLSYGVTQRTREIGIRVALGAQVEDVVRLIVGQGIRAALAGALVGGALAFLLGRAIASLLYQVAPTDPGVFLVAAGVLTGVALVAAYLPARRASRLAPTIALQAE